MTCARCDGDGADALGDECPSCDGTGDHTTATPSRAEAQLDKMLAADRVPPHPRHP